MGNPASGLTAVDIEEFLRRLGERIQQPTTLHLVGGGALCLLGSPRRTLDIDYVGSDLPIPGDVFTQYAHVAIQQAHDFDIDHNEFRLHLAALNDTLG